MPQVRANEGDVGLSRCCEAANDFGARRGSFDEGIAKLEEDGGKDEGSDGGIGQ